MSEAFQLAIGTNTPTNVSAAAGQINVSDPQFLSLAGGSSNFVLTTDGASHLTWKAPPGAGTVAEAPMDDGIYGRSNASWVGVLPLTGGILSGPLTLAGPPTVNLQAATKAYVDAHVSPVTVDGTSITGNGTTTPLSVAAIDAGTY